MHRPPVPAPPSAGRHNCCGPNRWRTARPAAVGRPDSVRRPTAGRLRRLGLAATSHAPSRVAADDRHARFSGDDPGTSRPPDGCSTRWEGFQLGTRESVRAAPATRLRFLPRRGRAHGQRRVLGPAGRRRLHRQTTLRPHAAKKRRQPAHRARRLPPLNTSCWGRVGPLLPHAADLHSPRGPQGIGGPPGPGPRRRPSNCGPPGGGPPGPACGPGGGPNSRRSPSR